MSARDKVGYRCAHLMGLIAGLAVTLLAVSPGLVVAQESRSQPPAETVTNALCPVIPDEPIDLEQSTIYEGKRVFLCCAMCKRKFERNPEAYLAALPQFNRPEAFQAEAADGHDEGPNSQGAPGAGAETVSENHERAEPDDHADSPETAGDDEDLDADNTEHAHSAHPDADADATSLGTRIIKWLGKSHPASVHFPIALMLSGSLAELMSIGTGRLFFRTAAQFCVWLGSVSTMGAVTLGWFFAGFKLSDGDWIMTTHRWLGTSAGVWAILVFALCVAASRHRGAREARWRPWYLLALFIGSGMIAINGFLGGALIYGLDHLAW